MDTISKVYLTDDEDIRATCATGVFRPSLRVHLPLGRSYAKLSGLERSMLWAFEGLVKQERTEAPESTAD